MTIRNRALWLVVSALCVFVAVTGLMLLQLDRVQRQQDRDMCTLIAALLPRDAPAPASSYGQRQREALQRYRAARC